MRALLLAMIICGSLAAAGCTELGSTPSGTAPDSTTTPIPTGGWIELHLEWQRGGRPVWNNTTYTASEAEEWATDGNSFFYARLVDARQDHETCSREGPADARSSTPQPHVFIARWERGCLWALHPSYECWRVSFCETRTPPAGPPPTVDPS